MSKIKSYFILFVCCFGISSCEDKGDVVTYRIENATESNVEIQFFSTDQSKTGPNNVESISGKGLVIERSIEIFQGDSNNPGVAFQTDSVVVIFDHNRYESHYGGTFPALNSILDGATYNRKKGVNSYSISQKKL